MIIKLLHMNPHSETDNRRTIVSKTGKGDPAGGIGTLARRLSLCTDARSAAMEGMRAAVDLLNADTAAILLTDRRSGHLEFYDSMNMPQEILDQSRDKVEWSHLIEGEAARKRAPVLIPKIHDDDRAQFYGEDTLSVCSVPMVITDKVIGVLTVSTHDLHRLDQDDMALLHTLGCLLALSLESHYLMQSLQNKNREMDEQNQDLDELLSTVSHDLRSPLATIGGYASLLAKKSERVSPEEEVLFAKTIFRKTRETSQRLSDAVTFFRTSFSAFNEEAQLVNVREVLDSSLEEAASKDRRAQTVLVIPEKLPTLWGNGGQLARIFENLLSNAFKFTGSTPEPKIIIGYEKSESGKEMTHIFQVIDNGPGIPEEYRESVFKLFSTGPSDNDTPGAGVGLAVVERIVTVNGGAVTAGDGDGTAGAVFTFTLPWLEADRLSIGDN